MALGSAIYESSYVKNMIASPVAQSVERWTPCGESTYPGYKSPGFEGRGRSMFMSLQTGMVVVGGRSQARRNQ